MVKYACYILLVVFSSTIVSSLYTSSSLNNDNNYSGEYNNASVYRNFSLGDVYLDDAYDTCVKYRTSLKCAKYRALKYMYDLTSPYQGLDSGIALGSSVRLVTINRRPMESTSPLFPDSQPRAVDSELDRVFRFGLRGIERFVRARAVTMDLPVAAPGARGLDEDAPRLVDAADQQLQEEGRGKKKKIALLLPLVLFFKIKALLVPILLGVLFIKKLLILAAVLLPGLLSLVKHCKPHPHHGGYHTVQTGYSGDIDSSGEFSSGGGGGYGSSHYPSRRTQQNQAYRGYKIGF